MEHTKVKTVEKYENEKAGLSISSIQISARSHVVLTPDRTINQTEVGYLYNLKDHLPKFDYPHKHVVACPEITPTKLKELKDGNEFVKFKSNIKRIFNQTDDKIKSFVPRWRHYKKGLSYQDHLIIIGAGQFVDADIVGLPANKINTKHTAIVSRMNKVREYVERNGDSLTVAPSFSVKTTTSQLIKNIKAVYDAGFRIINIDNGGYSGSWYDNYPRYVGLSNLDLEGFYIMGGGVPRRWHVNSITSQSHLLTLMGQHSITIEVPKPFAPESEKTPNVLARKLNGIFRLDANDLGYYSLTEHIRRNGNKILCKSDCPICRGNEGLLDIYRKSNKAGLNSVFNNVHDAYDGQWGMEDLREGIMADDLNDRLKKRVALQKAISSINSQTKL